ncbi:hypothetical protein Tco_0625423 [Tanacetum coccineum]|uniref:Uncharacterized protein n=1 Tax=Tanacetum coccineum TaxID=301880 RepID=A0ABQ4WGS5_9ASTR
MEAPKVRNRCSTRLPTINLKPPLVESWERPREKSSGKYFGKRLELLVALSSASSPTLHEMIFNRVAFPWLLPSPYMIKVSFPQGMLTIFSAHTMTAWSPTVMDQMAHYVAPVAFGTFALPVFPLVRLLLVLVVLAKCFQLPLGTSPTLTGVSSLIPSSSRIPNSSHVATSFAIPDFAVHCPCGYLSHFLLLLEFSTTFHLVGSVGLIDLPGHLSLFPESHREQNVYEVSFKGKIMTSVRNPNKYGKCSSNSVMHASVDGAGSGIGLRGRIRRDKKNGGSRGVGASSSAGTKSSGCFMALECTQFNDPPSSRIIVNTLETYRCMLQQLSGSLIVGSSDRDTP